MRVALPRVGVNVRQSRGFILGNLALGHGINHWYFQSFFVIQPYIKAAMGLSDVQFGFLSTTRSISAGAINIPGGFLIDAAKRQWGLILTACMVMATVFYALAGVAPNYVLLLLVMVVIGWPGSLWHLPALASLSQRFPDKRGFAISIHGMGGNIGNFMGPVIAGLLLGVVLWRSVLFIYAFPAALMTLLIWWSLGQVGHEGGEESRRPAGSLRQAVSKAVSNPTILALLLVVLLRNMGSQALSTWTPLYLKEEVLLNPGLVGLYTGLLTGLGTFAAPVFGSLSDRHGRKAVLFPGLVISAGLAALMVSAGASGLAMLTLLIAVMGLFTYSLQQLIQAAVLDITGRGNEGTTMGIVFGFTGIISAFSPTLAAVVKGAYGLSSVFYYIAILTALAAALLLFTPMRRPGAGPGVALPS